MFNTAERFRGSRKEQWQEIPFRTCQFNAEKISTTDEDEAITCDAIVSKSYHVFFTVGVLHFAANAARKVAQIICFTNIYYALKCTYCNM